MKTRPEIGEIEPEVLSVSGIEEVRRHPASYSEKNLVATIDNFRWRLEEEQKTIRLLEDVAVKHGYDKEGGEDLAGWLDKHLNVTLIPNKKAQRASDQMTILSLRESITSLAKSRAELFAESHALRELKEKHLDGIELQQEAIKQRDQKIEQLQEQVDHWKKKYQEKIYANE